MALRNETSLMHHAHAARSWPNPPCLTGRTELVVRLPCQKPAGMPRRVRARPGEGPRFWAHRGSA